MRSFIRATLASAAITVGGAATYMENALNSDINLYI